MKTKTAPLYPLLAGLLVLSGCAIKTHSVYEDRKDQDLSGGNRGYLQGAPVQKSLAPEKTKREVKVVEIELYPWLHKPSEREAEKAREQKLKKSVVLPEKPAGEMAEAGSAGAVEQPAVTSAAMQEYTVLQNDTLQKISQKFYGTYKKWKRIYDANTDVLKSPNKLRQGQVLKIPMESKALAPVPQAPEKIK